MKTKITLLSISLLFSIQLRAQLPIADTEEFQITSSSAYETTPTLGNDGISDLVVFTTRPYDSGTGAGSGDIWYQRLNDDGSPSGFPIQVTSAATDDELNDTWGDYIVYTAYDNLNSASGTIMLYEISTASLHPLGSAEIMLAPHIDGDYVVWQEGGAFASQVMLYDINWLGTTLEAVPIAGPVPPTFNVEIGDRAVVWTQFEAGQYDVWLRDLDDSSTFPLTSTATTTEANPATSGAWVVWNAAPQGTSGTSIVAMNVDTFETRVIVDNGAGNYNPTIDGDLIAWESPVNGNWDLFVYSLSTGETFQVTTNQADQFLNDIQGDLVAYADNRNGAADIYVSRIMFPKTYVPDNNFEQELITLGYDDVMDDYVITSNISGITSLDVSNKGISDLTGIEDFKDLTELQCYGNQLTSLDVTQNTALSTLQCHENNLTSLDLSQNTALTNLNCIGNILTNLDLSHNTALTSLECSNNLLESLDVRNGNNTSLGYFKADGNPLLTCIQVDDEVDANNGLPPYDTWEKDATASYSEDCHYGFTYVPDDNFEHYLETHNPIGHVVPLGDPTSMGDGIDGNDFILTERISGITSFDIINKNVADLTGIEDFINLTWLRCFGNQLTELDVSRNTKLLTLDCGINSLTSLDVSQNTALQYLYCYKNQLTSLDLSQNTVLEDLICFNNQLTSLELSNNTELKRLTCYSNSLTDLELSQNIALTSLGCSTNLLESLDVRNGNNTSLGYFDATGNPLLTCIQVDNESDAIAGLPPYDTWRKDDTASYAEDCSLSYNLNIVDASAELCIEAELVIQLSDFNDDIGAQAEDVVVWYSDEARTEENIIEAQTITETGIYMYYAIVSQEGVYKDTNADLTITIHPIPEVTLEPFNIVCPGSEAFALTGGLPEGGTYSGDFVTDGLFDLAASGQGSFTIEYTVENEFGCLNSASQILTVEDITAPVPDLTTLPDVLADCEVTELTEPTATDNCAGVVPATHDAILPITGEGTTVITWTFDDGNGNTVTQTQQVIIEDETSPVPDVAILPDLEGKKSVEMPIAPTATDNCSGVIAATTDAIFPITDEGLTIITWVYDDGNGNIAIQTQNVIVNKVKPNEITVNHYPNPFSESITFEFEVPYGTNFSIYIFNLSGSLVAQLTNGTYNIDTYLVTWNASYVNDGIYFYKLRSNGLQIGKGTILKSANSGN